MRKTTFILFLTLLFHLVNDLQAQEDNVFSSLQFEQFHRTSSLYTPCNIDADHSTSLRLGNRSFTGLFRGVNRLYFDVEHQLTKKNNSVRHIGLLIKSENEIILGNQTGLDLMNRSVRHLSVVPFENKPYLLVVYNDAAAEVYQLTNKSNKE